MLCPVLQIENVFECPIEVLSPNIRLVSLSCPLNLEQFVSELMAMLSAVASQPASHDQAARISRIPTRHLNVAGRKRSWQNQTFRGPRY